MKILIIKSLFCPTAEYYRINVNSLMCVNNCINSAMSADLYLIGWVYLYKNDLDSFILRNKMNFTKINKDTWPINFGKYKLYNRMIDIAKSYLSYDIIIYMDHDVYFDKKNHDELTELLCTINTLRYINIKSRHLGMIAFNQTDDVRHRPDIYENSIDYNGIKLVYPNCVGSIAGGAFLIFPETLSGMNYFDEITIYGLDDYYFDQQLIQKGYINVVLRDIYIIHPFDANNNYKTWKHDHLLKLIQKMKICDAEKGNKSDYYREIQDSINFWTSLK